MSTNHKACPICGQAHTGSACPASPQPAGAEPSPEGLCVAQKILTHDRQLRERTNGHDACYPEEAAIWIDAAFAPLRAELATLRSERDVAIDKLLSTITQLRAELERVKGENDRIKNINKTGLAMMIANERDQLRSDLTAARARIGELEKERQFPDIGPDPLKLDGDERIAYRSDDTTLARLQKATSLQQKEVPDQTALVWRADLNWLIGQFIWRQAGHKHAITRNESLLEQLALANAKAEEARRAGVKCFDESHPDDLGQRIHAIMEAHEKEHRHHIYRRSLLEKAIFELLLNC